MHEWKPYKAIVPPPKFGKTYELTHVFTIMHIQDAIRTIEDSRISARLVYDESRLKNVRLPVVWSSANEWKDGSFYGTVGFKYDWAPLVTGKKFYWVEAIKSYNPDAYRILICDESLTPPPRLTKPYNPLKDRGPLRFWKEKWYWNAEFTSEFMYAGDIELSKITNVSFFKHHQSICRYHQGHCEERDLTQLQSAATIMALILSRGLHIIDRPLLASPLESTVGLDFDRAKVGLKDDFDQNDVYRSARISTDDAIHVLKGAFSLYAGGQKTDAQQLVWQSMTRAKFEKAYTKLLKHHFGLPQSAI